MLLYIPIDSDNPPLFGMLQNNSVVVVSFDVGASVTCTVLLSTYDAVLVAVAVSIGSVRMLVASGAQV